ncbi:hypothetical protein LTR97_002537 [Elasticomyces elasticus]|uniref:Uncharacterized protein n=1 Tax=Elasticomyces elasticus TaxID=574655 RepID=A0AAN7VVG6_9PEZI|nr:hypothetical protein LTR97_002537 [Elasticomyces elasticus]
MVPLPPFSHLACEQSLTTSALELKYARSTHLIDIITQEESHRRLRFDIHILEDDNDELRDLLSREEERSDSFERYVNVNLIRAEEAEARLQDMELDLRTREQELTTMRAEKDALQQYNTVDLTAAVTEKLAMTRELSVLRPELEHLKTQAANAETLMAEKLALQRQISEVQCEVENAKREARRALAKRRNTGVEIAQEEQMDELRRQLKKAERARVRAEEAADVTQADLSIDEVRKELAREKRGRQKAEQALEEAQQNTQIEDVRKDLLKEKKAKQKLEDALESLQTEIEKEKKAAARAVTKRGDGNAATDEQAEELRQALAKEKKARVSAERSVKQAAEEYGSQKAVLEDKLGQFRTKLRSSKTELKEKDAELDALKAELAATGETMAPAKKTVAGSVKAPAKNTKKRPAAQLEADATTLGTPGDGPAAKRSRKAPATTAGDKSTFSVTPFLNRTVSVAPDDDEEEKSEDEDAEASPKPAKKAAKQPLASQSVNVPTKSKAPAQQRKPKVATKLAMVTEESEDVHSQGQENSTSNKPVTMKIKTKISDGPDDAEPGAAAKSKKKIRKSIHDFAAFTAAVDEDEKTVVKQKKRKLGGLGKTLFDEEEEMAPKALPGRGLFGVKGANFGSLGMKKGGMGSSSFLGAKSRLGKGEEGVG